MNNSSGGAVAIFAILMVAITLGAGYLYSKNEDLFEKERIAHQGMEEVLQRYEDLEDSLEKVKTENQQIRAQLEMANKDLDALRLKNTELTTLYQQEHQAYLAAEEARRAMAEEMNARGRAQVMEPKLLQKVEENPNLSQRSRERNKSAAPAQLSAALDNLLPSSVNPAVLAASTLGIMVFGLVLFGSYQLVRGEAKPAPMSANFVEDQELRRVVLAREEAAPLPREKVRRPVPAEPQPRQTEITLEPSWDRRKGLLRKQGMARQ